MNWKVNRGNVELYANATDKTPQRKVSVDKLNAWIEVETTHEKISELSQIPLDILPHVLRGLQASDTPKLKQGIQQTKFRYELGEHLRVIPQMCNTIEQRNLTNEEQAHIRSELKQAKEKMETRKYAGTDKLIMDNGCLLPIVIELLKRNADFTLSTAKLDPEHVGWKIACFGWLDSKSGEITRLQEWLRTWKMGEQSSLLAIGHPDIVGDAYTSNYMLKPTPEHKRICDGSPMVSDAVGTMVVYPIETFPQPEPTPTPEPRKPKPKKHR